MTGSVAQPHPNAVRDPDERWRILLVLGLAELLAMSPWFSASAVAPLLIGEWGLADLDVPLLTVTVQLGFVAGALLLALTGAVDVVRGRVLFLAGASLAAAANLGFAYVASDLASALPFRFLTGFALAGVYPVGMKILAGWFRLDRGFAIGVLVGALTVGSALPHLFRGIGAMSGLDWHAVVAGASVAGVLGGMLVAALVATGPFDVRAPRFSLSVARRAFGERAVRLANLGYLGHMWEALRDVDVDPRVPGRQLRRRGDGRSGRSELRGIRRGRSRPRGLRRGWRGGGPRGSHDADHDGHGPQWLERPRHRLPVRRIAGADADPRHHLGDPRRRRLAQFSVAVTELGPPGTAGSALALQTVAGFLLTGMTILLVGLLGPTGGSGWQMAFALLAVGPAVGIVAMGLLRGLPEARRMADGRR